MPAGVLNRFAGGRPLIGACMSVAGMGTGPGVPGVLVRLLVENTALRLVTEPGLSVTLL